MMSLSVSRKLKYLIIVLTLSSSLVACVELDSVYLEGKIRLEPTKSDDKFDYYLFSAPCARNYAVDSDRAEEARMYWL